MDAKIYLLGGEMFISAAAAKALASVILIATQGHDFVTAQLPLHAEDRGRSWLVTGTPFTDPRVEMRFLVSHVFIDKTTAEAGGIGNDGRMIPSHAEAKHWADAMSPAQHAAVFGPATRFEPDGIPDIFNALYGGLINTPADAIDYAAVLLQASGRLAGLTKADLAVVERDKVWHATLQSVAVISFSRTTGKLLSGTL